MGLEVLGYAACGQVSAFAEKGCGQICSVSTKVDSWRLRLTAEDFQSHGSSGAAGLNIIEEGAMDGF